MKVKNVKAKVSEKVTKAKAKVKAKVGKTAKVVGLAVVLASLVGCMDTNPASRATASTDTIGDIVLKMEGCSNCTYTINFTKGDSALASADSSGNTETQTASPTQSTDVSPKTDVNTTGGRTAGVLETAIQAGANWLLTPSAKDTKAAGAATAGDCADGSCTDSSACKDCEL